MFNKNLDSINFKELISLLCSSELRSEIARKLIFSYIKQKYNKSREDIEAEYPYIFI